LRQLLGEVRPISGRSWIWRDAVVVSVRPVTAAWPSRACEVEGLRAEPKSGSMHPGPHDFAQFDLDAPDKLRKVLDLTTDMEVKLYSADFWENIEQELYEGNADLGSHNQTLTKVYGLAGGTAAGANRTEVMNLVADLLGFRDLDKEKSSYLRYQIWAETHRKKLPSEVLEVTYGFGGEFKADKIWQQKKEANVAEALIGALDSAGLGNLVSAVSALCFLMYMDPLCQTLPSNWAMAEKLLAVKEREDWVEHLDWYHRHLDVTAFTREMDRCLS